MKTIWTHYLFYDQSHANDFFLNTNSEYLLNIERYTMFIGWEVFDAVKKYPTVGFNIEPSELQYARNYKSFLAYERSVEPLEVFGDYHILGRQNFRSIKKFLPLKLLKIKT